MLKKISAFLRRLFYGLRTFRARKYVYYIGGADTLPPPLTEEEEEEALFHIEERKYRDLLVEHNLRLVVFIAKRFENTGAGIEELISLGTVGLMKAVSTFQAEKNIRLATYASRCIENEILMFLRKSVQRKKEISLDEPLSVDYDGNELLLSDILPAEGDAALQMEEEEERAILRSAVSSLSPREKVIIDMRYGLSGGEELTQKEVADRLGISQSYISRLEKKIIGDLRKKIEQKT